MTSVALDASRTRGGGGVKRFVAKWRNSVELAQIAAEGACRPEAGCRRSSGPSRRCRLTAATWARLTMNERWMRTKPSGARIAAPRASSVAAGPDPAVEVKLEIIVGGAGSSGSTSAWRRSASASASGAGAATARCTGSRRWRASSRSSKVAAIAGKRRRAAARSGALSTRRAAGRWHLRAAMTGSRWRRGAARSSPAGSAGVRRPFAPLRRIRTGPARAAPRRPTRAGSAASVDALLKHLVAEAIGRARDQHDDAGDAGRNSGGDSGLSTEPSESAIRRRPVHCSSPSALAA